MVAMKPKLFARDLDYLQNDRLLLPYTAYLADQSILPVAEGLLPHVWVQLVVPSAGHSIFSSTNDATALLLEPG